MGGKPRRSPYLDTAQRVAYQALTRNGDRRSIVRFEWNVAGNCQSPVYREMFSRPSAAHRRPLSESDAIRHPLVLAVLKAFPGSTVGDVKVPVFNESRYIVVDPKKGSVPVLVEITARCRKCDACLRVRSREWARRSRLEIAQSVRTWWGTLTLSDDTLFKALAVTRRRLSRGGTVFEDLTTDQRFAEVVATLSRDLTLYLKRVRKQSGAALRFIAVWEAHPEREPLAPGVPCPHVHALVHECDAAKPVRKRVLDGQWKALGFSRWRLFAGSADLSSDEVARLAGYVTKYLSKSALARVRASKRYGSTSYGTLSDSGAERNIPYGTALAPASGGQPRGPGKDDPAGAPECEPPRGAHSLKEKACEA